MAHGLDRNTYIEDPHSFDKAALGKVLSAGVNQNDMYL